MRALILVDLQYDFCPGGALAVARGDETIEIANRLLPYFSTTVATQDWHPADHQSFAAQHPGRKPGDLIDLNGLPQVVWPPHCVQGSRGAELHAGLARDKLTEVFRKGTDRGIDSYSGFFDNGHRKSTGLAEWLRERWITRVYVMGLATDYCVKATALDARELGFDTWVVEDGCRPVELIPATATARSPPCAPPAARSSRAARSAREPAHRAISVIDRHRSRRAAGSPSGAGGDMMREHIPGRASDPIDGPLHRETPRGEKIELLAVEAEGNHRTLFIKASLMTLIQRRCERRRLRNPHSVRGRSPPIAAGNRVGAARQWHATCCSSWQDPTSTRSQFMHVLITLIVGLVVGALAKLIMPGRDPGGILITMLLGIAGAFVAGALGHSLGWYALGEGPGLLASVLGSVILLAIYRLVAHPRRTW